MPPPDDGNEYRPFADLIDLEQIDSVTFRSIALPHSPGGQNTTFNPGRTYGGHVYAQAAWAACQTVAEDQLIYNVVGTFLLPGQVKIPFVYTVHKIRDGRSFSTRIVHVTQGDSKAICFTGLISFKTEEKSLMDVQERVDLWETYKVALEGKRPDDFPEVDAIDMPSYWTLRAQTGHNNRFPGLESTKVDMDAYNEDRHPLDRRQLMFYRVSGTLSSHPNLHLCAHLYESDRNSLFIVTNNMGTGNIFKSMATLVHMTAFHFPVKALMFGPSETANTPMDSTDARGRWFANEGWTTRSSSGRAVYQGRLWAPDGTQIATMTQDGMIRYTEKPEATQEELDAIQEGQRHWKSREKL